LKIYHALKVISTNLNFIITLITFIAVSSRLIIFGDVYGLNFNIFQPDGGNYQYFTEDILNLKISNSGIYSWSRPLYPILSLPFYFMLGKYGMLVIPSLSLLLIGFLFLHVSPHKKDKFILLLCFLILTSSGTFLRWTIANLTDSLHLLIFTLCCVALLRNWGFQNLIFITLVGALVRPMGPIWAALFLAYMIQSKGKAKKKYAILTLLSLILFFINTFVMAFFGGFSPNEKSLTSQITLVPINFVKLLVVEFGQLVVLDRLLFYFVAFTLVLAVMNFKNQWSLVHILVTFGCFLISAWIGVYGVNFRYQLPMTITGSILILLNFGTFSNKKVGT
jgi:hypothetical protein